MKSYKSIKIRVRCIRYLWGRRRSVARFCLRAVSEGGGAGMLIGEHPLTGWSVLEQDIKGLHEAKQIRGWPSLSCRAAAQNDKVSHFTMIRYNNAKERHLGCHRVFQPLCSEELLFAVNWNVNLCWDML